MIIKYFDITEDELKSAPFTPGAVYFCSDTKNMYYDRPESSERVKMSDVIVLDTDEERMLMLAPVPFKMYYIRESGKFYINDGTNWNNISSSDFVIHVSGNDIDGFIADKNYSSILSAYTSGLPSIRVIFNGLTLYLSEFADTHFLFSVITSTDNINMLMIRITIDINNTITYEEISGGNNDTETTIVDDVLYVRSKQYNSSIEDDILVLR